MYTVKDLCEMTGYGTNKIYPLINKSGLPVKHTTLQLMAGNNKRPTKVRCFTKKEAEKLLHSTLEYKKISRNLEVIRMVNENYGLKTISDTLGICWYTVKEVVLEHRETGLVTVESKLNYMIP